MSDSEPVSAGRKPVATVLNNGSRAEGAAGDFLEPAETYEEWIAQHFPLPAPRRHRRRLIVAITLFTVLLTFLAAGGAYLVADRGDTVYGARAEIVFDAGSVDSTAQSERLMANQVVVARSRGVLAPVAASTGVAVTELEDALSASVVGESSVVRLTVSSPDPAQATRLVEAIADAYVAEVAKNAMSEAETFLDQSIGAVNDEQARVAERLVAIDAAQPDADAPATAEERLLELQAENLFQQLGVLQSRLVDAQLQAGERARATLVGSPYALDEPLGPKPSQAAAIGALAGLAIAGSVAVALWQLTSPR